MKIHKVEAHRVGRWWMVETPYGTTQASVFSEIPTAAREYIAVTLDVPLDEVEVRVKI